MSYLSDFVSLFFPPLCYTCNNPLLKNETNICTECLYHLPRTKFHLLPDNPVEQIFWGRVKIESATALYFFNKGSKYQKLIHLLKYKGKTDIGTLLGLQLGNELNESKKFNTVDVVVPVPLHPHKFKKRGYNQSSFIAKGVAKSMKTAFDEFTLLRTKNNPTQTKKSRFERWKNVETVFELSDAGNFANKHVLIVDDVVTTGSTIEACAQTVLKAENAKVSIATIAFA